MSQASEWAYKFKQAELQKPKFECVCDDVYGLFSESSTPELATVAEVDGDGNLSLTGCHVSARDALALADWIKIMFGGDA